MPGQTFLFFFYEDQTFDKHRKIDNMQDLLKALGWGPGSLADMTQI